MINADSFCIGPWTEVRINPDGTMNFCHAADFAMIPSGDNIARYTVDDYFQTGASVTTVRRKLEQGELIDRCHKCYKNERAGLLSFRQRRNIQAAIFPGADFVPSVVEALPNIKQWQKPKFYHVSLSNLCNMACMMCDPRWSSLLTHSQQRAGLLSPKVPVLRDWTQNADTWQKFVDHLLSNQDIVCLHFMGGEPMYHKRFRELIDILVERNHSDFALTFVTNGSIYDADLMSKLQRFHSITIEISIESLDTSNDYIRFPSSYREVQHNIERYLTHRSDKISVVLRSVPQFLSVTKYDLLLKFAREHHVIIDGNALHSPAFLALNVLPDSIKRLAIERLSVFLQPSQRRVNDINLRDASDIDRCMSLHAQMVIDQINMPCEDQIGKWRQLVDYCRRMDAVRGLDVIQAIPDLGDFFEQQGYHD